MSTGPTLYLELERSKTKIDLTTGRYRIGSDFTPPTVRTNVVLASGTSSNRSGRMQSVSRVPQPTSFGFDLQTHGDSAAETNRALADIQSLLSWAGDEFDALYLVYKPNSDTPEPLFGQDGSVRYKVLKGEVSPGDDYAVRPLREKSTRDNRIELLLQPYAEGRKTKLASAKGSIALIRASSESSGVVGISAPPPNVNYFHNPVFAHSTWNNKWTAAPGVVAFKNIDKRFVFIGEASAYLVAQPSGSRVLYQAATLTTTTHTISFYAKKADGSEVTSADAVCYFNNAFVTSTYKAIGDGWYRVSYTGTATTSTVNYGIGLAAGASLYVDGFQLESWGYPTPVGHCDSLGCSPAGTRHDSNTNKTTPNIIIESEKNPRLLGSGTISLIVTLPQATYASSFYLCKEASTGFYVGWDSSSGFFIFSDGTNAVSVSDSAVADRRIHLHITWGRSGIKIYKNGSLGSSSGSFSPVAAVGDMYLLTEDSSSPTLWRDVFLSEYVSWREELTATQILNDYTSKTSLDAQAINIPPILWTKDGDSVVDNCNDATRDNFAVALAVPGSAPALTRFDVEIGSSGTTADTTTIGNWAIREFIDPTRVLTYDQSGTADGSSSGGAYKRTSIGATEAFAAVDFSAWELSNDQNLLRFVRGKQFGLLTRIRDAGSGYLRWRHSLSNVFKQQPPRVSTPGGFFRNVILPALVIPDTDPDLYLVGDQLDVIVVNPSGAANVDIDFYMLFPHPALSFVGDRAIIDGRKYDAYFGTSAGSISSTVIGGEIMLDPGLYNVLVSSIYGSLSGLADNSITETLTYNFVEVTPRWELLS